MIIDISRELFSAPVYPGDPEPQAEFVSRLSDGGSCNLSTFFACVHNATHVDAPLHFLDGGDSIEKLPLEKFIGPCRVIEVPPGAITGEYVNRYFPPNCKRLIVKSGGKAWFMDNAAQEAADMGIGLIGTDAASVGTHGAQTEVHRSFLANDVALLEGLSLENVAAGEYFLFAPPLKLAGLEGAPTRAVLVSDYIFWSGDKGAV